jgi:hypothetical protein
LTSVTAAALKAVAPVSLTLVAEEEGKGGMSVDLIGWLAMAEVQKGHTKDDLVTLFPHLCYQSLAGNDGSSESNLDVRVRAEGLQDVFTGNTHEAETVQDCQRQVISLFTSPATSLALCHSLGFLKPPIAEKAGSICSGLRSPESLRRTANQITLLHIPDVWSASPVDGSLLVSRLLLDDGIRLSLGWVVGSRCGSSICPPGQDQSHFDPMACWTRNIPAPFFCPPNPPQPRRTTVPWLVKTTLPVTLSTVSTTLVTFAALP